MSLKSFHIVFVTLSIVLSVGFGLWAGDQYMEENVMDERSPALLAAAAGGLGFALLLVVYGIWFLRKLKDMNT